MADRIRVSNPEADEFARITQRLRHYRSMVANYQACKELYDSLFPNCVQVLTDMPHGQKDTFEPEIWAGKRLDLSEQMKRSLDEMSEEISNLMTIMKSIEHGESAVLIRRYIFGETMEQVSDSIHYSVRWCWKTHNRAIDKIAKKGLCNDKLGI